MFPANDDEGARVDQRRRIYSEMTQRAGVPMNAAELETWRDLSTRVLLSWLKEDGTDLAALRSRLGAGDYPASLYRLQATVGDVYRNGRPELLKEAVEELHKLNGYPGGIEAGLTRWQERFRVSLESNIHPACESNVGAQLMIGHAMRHVADRQRELLKQLNAELGEPESED